MDTRLSVGANYFTDDSFWREEILFLRRELENKQKIIDKLFNILHNSNNEITKQFFLYNNAAKTKLSENVITNNSVINISNNTSIANSTKINRHQQQTLVWVIFLISVTIRN